MVCTKNPAEVADWVVLCPSNSKSKTKNEGSSVSHLANESKIQETLGNALSKSNNDKSSSDSRSNSITQNLENMSEAARHLRTEVENTANAFRVFKSEVK